MFDLAIKCGSRTEIWTFGYQIVVSDYLKKICVLLVVEPLDVRPHRHQLLLDLLVATIDVIDTIHQRLALGDKTSQNQRG